MSPLLPGATLGILGSGQLGRMFAMAARRMGYRVVVYSPDADSPAGTLADEEIVAGYEDEETLFRFADRVDAVTLEFENVPVAALRALEGRTRVAPGPSVLEITQHRLREKEFVRSCGIGVPAFARVASETDAIAAVEAVGPSGVLKTATLGYDGKGQSRVRPGDDVSGIWRSLGSVEAIYEAFVPFAGEYSALAARGPAGEIATVGPTRNEHSHHILDVSVYPAGLSPRQEQDARDISREIAERLDVVGLICVELFLTESGEWLVNELAPRPHNSKHWTIEGASISQFELQVRAICGLPLPEVVAPRPAAMANLLGDVWSDGEPRWDEALKTPETALHLYGKRDPRAGRKMGHLTSLAETPEQAEARVRAARAALLSPKTSTAS
ncbi:MAG TPA: 5-(carboxyamino)imidazole ribonucleotide synthase [Pirellulaceae bacterium]|jgi:5-(carboxyamino)imidazole ribonucleotide synthase|nr:5-(carboxyamino)imidazole ribonucleotide synthase [Pirellulaceae bacterium]